MSLSKRARIEIYLPRKNKAAYKRLRGAFEEEFLHTFGGCTVIRGIKGSYLNSSGERETDKIDLVYADTPFELEENLEALAGYTSELRSAVLETTSEESVLIVVHEIFHSV